MAIYQNKKEKNLFLKVYFDELGSESPRTWTNIGYFITLSSNYKSPDENETIRQIIDETQHEAQNSKEHMEIIKEKIKGITGEKVLAIYPITTYEHSNIVYKLGEIKGFDYSFNGFYIITDKTAKEYNTKDYKKIIEQELELYNKWVNGETLTGIIEKIETCKCCKQNTSEIIDSISNCYDEKEIFDNLEIKINDYKKIS